MKNKHASSHFVLLLALALTAGGAPLFAASPSPATINPDPPPGQLFETAAKAYEEGDLNRAIALYEALLDQGYKQAPVYFNLGNAHFRKGQMGKAILQFKRTLALTPHDADAKANLRFALEHAGALAPRDSLAHGIVRQLTPAAWLVLAAVFWWSLLLLLILRLVRPAWQSASRLAAAAFILLLLAAAATHETHTLRRIPEGVVIKPAQSALSAPLPNATELFKLPEGSLVRVQNRSGEWLNITVGNQSGWIRQSACTPVWPL